MAITKIGAVLLVVGLIVGLAAGYIVTPKGVDTTALEKQISDLQKQVGTLQSQRKEKDTQIATLQAEIERLSRLVVPPPKPGEPGTTRINPLPLGQHLRVDEWEIWVIEVKRDAYPIIYEMNTFNSKPKAGMEAVLVKVGVKLHEPATVRSKLSTFNFELVGEKGLVYEHRWDVLEPRIDQEIFGGTETWGYISFDVARGESNLIPIYKKAWFLAVE